ncbi:MAG: NAD(+)/NADH kinase [Chloroflexota bacterium]
MIERIGILEQPRIPASPAMAREIESWLDERGVASWIAEPWEDNPALDEQLANSQLLIVLGGDGSTLRAARLSVPYGVPLFGVNMGRVGFLSEATPEDWPDRLQKILIGDYWTERRLLINGNLWRQDELIDSFVALNEIVLGRGSQARVIRLSLYVDGDLVTTYIADALIVATPTGSTAYALAAGGPLLPPQLQNIVVVPVAAHLSLNRSLVLHEEAEIDIHIEMDHEAFLTADGQNSVKLEDGDRVLIVKYDKPCLFARVDDAGYFYRRLMQRLGFSWPHL